MYCVFIYVFVDLQILKNEFLCSRDILIKTDNVAMLNSLMSGHLAFQMNGKALLGLAADVRLRHKAPGPVGFWFEATDAPSEHSPPHPLRPYFFQLDLSYKQALMQTQNTQRKCIMTGRTRGSYHLIYDGG